MEYQLLQHACPCVAQGETIDVRMMSKTNCQCAQIFILAAHTNGNFVSSKIVVCLFILESSPITSPANPDDNIELLEDVVQCCPNYTPYIKVVLNKKHLFWDGDNTFQGDVASSSLITLNWIACRNKPSVNRDQPTLKPTLVTPLTWVPFSITTLNVQLSEKYMNLTYNQKQVS